MATVYDTRITGEENWPRAFSIPLPELTFNLHSALVFFQQKFTHVR